MFEKHLWKSDILSKDAGYRPGFYISQILVENGLRIWASDRQCKKYSKKEILQSRRRKKLENS